MTTLTELNGKVWYRFLKVIFILCYLSYFLLIFGVIYELKKDYHEPILPDTIQEVLKDPEFYKLDTFEMMKVLSSVDRKSNETWLVNRTTNERVMFNNLSYDEKNNYIRMINNQPIPTTLLPKKYIYKSYETLNIKNCVILGLVFTIFYILIMECIRRGFYYVVIGKVFPK